MAKLISETHFFHFKTHSQSKYKTKSFSFSFEKNMGIRKLFLPRSELEFERHRVEKSRSNKSKNYESIKRHNQHRSSGKSVHRGSSRRHKRRHKFFDQVSRARIKSSFVSSLSVYSFYWSKYWTPDYQNQMSANVGWKYLSFEQENMLYISTSFWVLHAPKSWWTYFYRLFFFFLHLFSFIIPLG